MESPDALAAGTVVGGDYRITGVLGQGGFGLTYRADDMRLGAPVAIKEFFPADMAVRQNGTTVRARSVREEGLLDWGRQKFLAEARTLARFRHPNIVRVARLFEENATAYMVLDFESGPSLAEWRRDLGGPPTQDEVDRIAAALCDAIEAVHEAGVLHRDIKPANVIMRDGRDAVLIDFGAARQSLGARSKTIHAIVTPGYSPKEQYAVDVDRQGTWTDVYALGATLYFLVTGRAPPDALTRDLSESMPLEAEADYRPALLEAIEEALRLDAADRPQTVAELRDLIFADGSTPTAAAWRRSGEGPRAGEPRSGPRTPTGERVSGPRRTGAGGRDSGPRGSSSGPRSGERLFTNSRDVASDGASPPAPEPEARRPRRTGLFVGLTLALAATAAGAGYWYDREHLAPAREQAAFSAARSADTVAAYDGYLARYANGRYAAEARERRASLAAAEPTPTTVATKQPEAAPAPPRQPSAPQQPQQPTAPPQQQQPATPPSQPPAPSTGAETTRPPTPAPLPPIGLPPRPKAGEVPPTTPGPAPPSTTTLPPVQLPPPPTSLPPPRPKTADAAPTPPTGPGTPPTTQPPAGPSTTLPPVTQRSLAPRPVLPGALAPGELERLQANLATSRWRMTLAVFATPNVRGYSELPTGFATELQRLTNGRVTLEVLTGANAIAHNELLKSLRDGTDLWSWDAPLRRSSSNSAYAVFAGLPFGLAPAEHAAWIRNAGADLLEQLHWRDGLEFRVVPCGIGTGAGGWYRREITTPADIRGLRVRTYGLVTTIMGRLGAVSVSTATDTASLRAAFTDNTLDAFLQVSAFGATFIRRAPQGTTPLVYHFPGWHQPSYLLDLQIPAHVWTAMGEPLQRLVDEACRLNLDRTVTESASAQRQQADLARSNGITVRPHTGPVLEALRKATEEVIAEEAARNPEFKLALDSYNRFRK